MVGFCDCSMFDCVLPCAHPSFLITLMGKRELVDLLNLSLWCLVKVVRLFLTVPRVCLQFVIVVIPDHSHLLFFRPGYVQTSLLSYNYKLEYCKFACGNYSYRTFLTEKNIAVD